MLVSACVISLFLHRVIDGEAMPADSWSLGGSGSAAETWWDAPSPSGEEAAQPLGVPMSVPSDDGFAFLQVQDDGVTPVAYDPCRPIHYVVRPENEPTGGRSLIADAVDEVSAITGLQFVDDGETSEDPSSARPLFQPDRYGDRWAPVLISWATAAEVPDFAGAPVGLGVSRAASAEGEGLAVYLSGSIELDADHFTELLSVPGGRAQARATVLHELGHVVGLDHVDDRTQLMDAQGSADVLDFAAGDLAGLAQLGAGECAPGL
ncbi:matrixin family metalloprotease [Modestobacter excelsi]|uniref:matrixin family metalloprotease n=1 Tax=Modestobacter excelsi TaxID=2213161 RepID=UPI00110CFB19|nr:matrixin family metalloprotease [Modestobacter excelsi]